MKKNPIDAITLIAGILITASACGKKAPNTPQPDLTAPERAFSSLSFSAAQNIVPAEIEVKASSSPVELSLGLYKTKIAGGYPKFRVRLKNTGKNKIRVLAEPFIYPLIIQSKGEENNTGTYLEIINSAGKTPALRRGSDVPLDGKFPPPILTENDHAEIERWKNQRLGDEEIARRISALLRRNHPPTYADPTSFWMESGASTATVAWTSPEITATNAGDPEQTPVGDFAKLSLYYLPPGKYRLRAVYDEYSDPEYYKKHHIKPEDWFVLVKTPYIDFEVLP